MSDFLGIIDLSSLDRTVGFKINGESAYDLSGWFVSAAGDINGDGIGDLIIGAPFADPNGVASAGSSYVVSGTSAGFADVLELSSLD
ncbi:MAG: integrin alpha, partial [Pseudomonadota bacterium]